MVFKTLGGGQVLGPDLHPVRLVLFPLIVDVIEDEGAPQTVGEAQVVIIGRQRQKGERGAFWLRLRFRLRSERPGQQDRAQH